MVTTTLTLPQQLARMDLERLRAYQEHLEFYRGAQWQGPSRRRERRLTFNYAKVFLDKLTSYHVSGLSFDLEPLEATEEARQRARRAEEAVRQVYLANQVEGMDFDTELDAAILGDGCYKVTWDPAAQQVRISAPDVQGIYAWWVGDDLSRIWRVASRYKITWEAAELLYGALRPLGARPEGEATVVEVWTDRAFQLWLEDALLEDRANPYGFIPFIIFPNLREPKRFWGTSDVPPLMEPSREMNRALSQMSSILELSGNPIAVLEGVEQAQDIAVQPGAVWEVPERARAYLLDLLQGGGVRLHIDYVDLLYRALHDLAETPRTAFGDNPRSLSGVALEMEMHPLLQKVRRKRLVRTAAYRRRIEMVLRLLEQHTGERYLPLRTNILWGPVLPQDRGRLVQEERTLVEAGLHSRRRAMALLGVDDPEGEAEVIRGEETTTSGKG